jgi:hypothetical protein
MPRGYLDTTHIDFPPGFDEAYVRRLANRVGVRFERVLQLINARLVAASSAADPLVAALAYFTPEPDKTADPADAFELEEEDEYGLARPEVGEPPRGYLLPFRRYRKAMGLTEDSLEDADEARILGEVDKFLRTFQRGLVRNVFARFWGTDEPYVDPRRTAVRSPGFAGVGTGDNVFGGFFPDGQAVPAGYTHYHRDTAANRAALIRAMRAKLARWHPGPYDLAGSEAEVAAIVALGPNGGFTKATADLILRAQGVAAALVDNNRYVGVFDDDVRVWIGRPELGVSPNFAVFKTYGDFDQRNPLAIRYDPKFGRGIDVKYRDLYPLANAQMRQRYGVGVGDRVGAALARIADAGGYVAPVLV